MTKQSVKHPAADNQWKKSFRAATFRTAFSLNLSQTMIEFISAVADGVQWDRALYESNIYKPDNWMATSIALFKRGLIERKPQEEIDAQRTSKNFSDAAIKSGEFYEYQCWNLTAAGEALVQLFRVTDIFVESDAAINKRHRRKA